jgi:hypothetical protein
MKSTTYSIKVLSLLVTVMLAACDVEEFPLMEESAQTGRIVLSAPEIQLYTEGGTRGEGDNVVNGNIADYTYILKDKDGTPIQEVTFDNNGAAIIPAGTYTLTATSSTAQDEAPWYQGTSDEFTLTVGGSESVSIDLDKPKNVEIVVTFDDTFTALYTNCSVTIGSKSVSDDGNLYAMPDSEGKVSYTIKGTARQGSHVTDIPAEGTPPGTISVVAGKSYPLNISAQSIDDLLIEFGGDYNSEFDTKEYRPLN